MGSFKHQIFGLKKRIDRVKGCRDARSITDLAEVEKEVQRVLKQEEDFWRQMAKIFWL